MLTKNLLDQLWNLCSESKLKTVSLNFIVNLISDEESQKCVAGLISKLLSTSSSKIEGLELLNACLCNFTSQIISDHGPTWIRCCLNHHEQDINKETYLKTLANIIKYSQNDLDFNKKFVSEFLTATLDTSLMRSADLNVKESRLNCLVYCLSHYASSCNSYKRKITDYILNYLSISSKRLVALSGLAFFYSQQIGNAGSDGINHINNITLSLRRLCVTCHTVLDSIFETQVEFERFDSNDIEALSISPVPPHYNTYMKLQYKTQVLKNCLHWIMILLRKSTTKVIYPQEIISVIRRVIWLHVCLEEENMSVESSYLGLYLIEIQTEISKLLEILIRQMGYLLAPFYHTITKIILDLITRSQSCSCYHKNSLMQEYLYNVLSSWLKVGRNGFEQSLQDKIVSCIIRDAFPVTSGVTLKMNASLIGKSPKFKRKSIKNRILADNKTALLSVESRNYDLNICINALSTLNILLNHTCLSVHETILSKLCLCVIKTLVSIQNGRAIFPFDDQKCQILLYKVLHSMFEQDAVKILPPIQIVLNLFRHGCKHENMNISTICFDGLNNLEKICQPVCSSMYISDNKRVSNNECSQVYVEQDVINGTNLMDSFSKDDVINVPLKEKTAEVTVLFNEVLVAAQTNNINEEDVIEIEDNECDNLERNGVTTSGDNEPKYDENDEDIIDLDMEDYHVQEKVQLKYVKSIRNNKGEKLEDEPVPKKKKAEDDDSDIINSLVDEVNDDYE